ncbi:MULTISPECIES: ATP-binding protein [unclassified Streptomyces]|uniref:ATP-binding protein n=1 Tax=unclassified Streptomyces TaxID=2593676 RepID=UPI002E2E8817|nr:ATP-binding protein [Streptomyces sp. NBC_00223]
MTAPVEMRVCSVRLAAVPAAVRLSRAFVRRTLTGWQLLERADSAQLIVSELATNAVREATGIGPNPFPFPFPFTSPRREAAGARHVIGVQLRLVDRRLYVEVWDGGGGTPAVAAASGDAEGGRGLLLVQALSERWGTAHPAAGGKVVWSELELTAPADSPAARTGLPQGCPDGHDPAVCEELRVVDFALMQRVVDGLCSAPRHSTGTAAVV